jgi:hypothetical protein
MGVPDVITVRDALAAGATRDMLRGRRWRAPFRGVRASAALEESFANRCRALRAVLPPGSVFSGITAALIYGWWLPACALSGPLEVTVPAKSQVRRPGVRCRRSTLGRADVCERFGLPLTSPVRTILDLAAVLPLIDLVVIMDAALQMRACSLDELAVQAEGAGVRGIKNYRRALALCDGRSESPMETLERLLIVLSGLPAPIPQVKIYDADGVFIARVDLKAPGVPAVFEYDGADHNTPVNHARDVRRWRALRSAGIEVYPYTARDLFGTPHQLVVDYQRALGLPIDASVTEGWLREWKHSGFNR